MAGLDPATHPARVSVPDDSFSLADARLLGGRLKSLHSDRALARFGAAAMVKWGAEFGLVLGMNEKQSLRQSAHTHRAELARACPDFADRIAGLDLPIEKDAVVSFYWPMGDEADPRALAMRLGALGHALALPVVARKKSPLMFRRWREGDPLVVHPFGMHEPASDAPAMTPDVLLVPLLAFDGRGHRLGYGGGFYDRTLASLRTKLAIGVAYAGQEVDALPATPHDHPLDMVVTELGVRKFA
jgi:5-formyltetrahydrofolate cyclo-ligase